jgi:hypothetical protein
MGFLHVIRCDPVSLSHSYQFPFLSLSLSLFLQCFSFYVPFTDYLSFFLGAAASPSVLMELIIILALLLLPASRLLPSNKEKPYLEL